MQKRGRTTWSYRARLIILALLGISILLWLSLGILLIVHADSPQNANQSSALIEYKDICIQCHRRVFSGNNVSIIHHRPKGLNISVDKEPAIYLQANLGGNLFTKAASLP